MLANQSHSIDSEMPPPKSRTAVDQPCIYRAFSKERGGHYLHVCISRNGRIYQKYFPETRCGGEQHAMRAALAWRDTIIARHAPMSLKRFCSILRSNNSSGVAGIGRSTKRSQAQNGRITELTYWHAQIPTGDGGRRVRYFSVKKFGEDGAKQHAIEARSQGLSELHEIALRAAQQPQPISSECDIKLLDALMRAPAERRALKRDEREAKREQRAVRRQVKVALAVAAEKDALNRATRRNGEPYIARYATRKGTSFYWRVSVQRQGTLYRKSFSDSLFGGAAEALLAAKKWRDQHLCNLPFARKAVVVERLKATNTSGAVGVSRTQEVRNGNVCYSWVAHSPQIKGAPRRSKKYSALKYGEEEAFSLAVKAREKFVAELGETEFLPHPVARHMKHLTSFR